MNCNTISVFVIKKRILMNNKNFSSTTSGQRRAKMAGCYEYFARLHDPLRIKNQEFYYSIDPLNKGIKANKSQSYYNGAFPSVCPSPKLFNFSLFSCLLRLLRSLESVLRASSDS